MEVIEGIENCNEKYENLCIALGTFDGVHFGHQAVIKRAVDKAKELGGKSMVFTFSPHPLEVISSSSGPKLINTKEEKIKIIERMGVDILLFANFTVEFSELHPFEFFENIIKKSLNAVEIFVGFNYTFGKGGVGDTDYLHGLSKEFNIKINVVPPYEIDGEIISSTLIRNLILDGEIENIKKYLGYNFIISGKVIHGRKLGRKLGFPTANLKLLNKVYPPFGVYSVRLKIDGENKYRKGIMNIGNNPTLKPGELSVEVHIFDFNEDIYDKWITLEVLYFIREEKKYSGMEELIEAIKSDVKFCKEKK